MQQCLFTAWLIDLLIENNKTDTKSIEHLFNDMKTNLLEPTQQPVLLGGLQKLSFPPQFLSSSHYCLDLSGSFVNEKCAVYLFGGMNIQNSAIIRRSIFSKFPT